MARGLFTPPSLRVMDAACYYAPLMAVYSRKAIDHLVNPRNARNLDAPSGLGRAINDDQDVVTFAIRVEGDIITDAGFQAQGCAACIATASIATELVIGQSVGTAAAITVATLSDALGGIPATKLPRTEVTATAVRVAVEDYRSRTDS